MLLRSCDQSRRLLYRYLLHPDASTNALQATLTIGHRRNRATIRQMIRDFISASKFHDIWFWWVGRHSVEAGCIRSPSLNKKTPTAHDMSTHHCHTGEGAEGVRKMLNITSTQALANPHIILITNYRALLKQKWELWGTPLFGSTWWPSPRRAFERTHAFKMVSSLGNFPVRGRTECSEQPASSSWGSLKLHLS